MIVLVREIGPLVFPEKCSGFIKTKILANDLSYGRGFSFLTFWCQKIGGNITAVLCKFEDTFFIAANDMADFSEIKEFVFAVGFLSIQTDSETLNHLGLKETLKFVCLTKDIKQEQAYSYTETKNDFKKVYSLLFAGDEVNILSIPFESWYADLSHRIHHGTAFLEVLNDESALVASHITKTAAVISGVVTVQSSRHKGLGSDLIKRAVLKLCGKRIYVATDKRTADFYIKNGFTKSGEISIYKEL